MTPRGPDRYEAKAKELCLTEWRSIAAALRHAADEALERAAQDYERAHAYHRGLHGSLAVAAQLREMKSPAAAAEKRCGVVNDNDRAPSVCVLLNGHRGDHYETNVASWPNRAPPSEPAAPKSGWHPPHMTPEDYHAAQIIAPAPLLPRVLAALDIPSVLGNRERLALAAELRSYIAEQAAAQKKQGDVPGE